MQTANNQQDKFIKSQWFTYAFESFTITSRFICIYQTIDMKSEMSLKEREMSDT